MMKKIGVYHILAPSGSRYVGMTCDSFGSRWKVHRNKLKAGTHPCLGLQSAFYKYGLDALVFEVVLEWEDNGSKELHGVVMKSEQKVWDETKALGINLYNGRPTGTGSSFHSAETRKKIGDAARARMVPLDEALLGTGLATCSTPSELAEHMGMSWPMLQRRGVTRDQLKPKPKKERAKRRREKSVTLKKKVAAYQAIEIQRKRQARDEQIAESYSTTSLTLVELAELYGVTRQTISAALRRQGISTRGQKRRFENRLDLPELANRNAEGETLTSLAAEVGLHRRILSRYLKEWRTDNRDSLEAQ